MAIYIWETFRDNCGAGFYSCYLSITLQIVYDGRIIILAYLCTLLKHRKIYVY